MLAANKSALRSHGVFWGLALVIASLQAWVARFTLVNDTVSYLDMGDYIWRGQWGLAINGLWNPLYAIILGASLTIFRPTPLWEYPLVHVVLFLVFVATLGAFTLLLNEWIALRRDVTPDQPSVPEWAWLTIGYAIFFWASFRMIGVGETNPDMIVAAALYLSCAFLIRIHRRAAGLPTYLTLGLVLGLGYLTKSTMFPIGAMLLASAFVVGHGQPRNARRVGAALLMFLLLSAPFVVALSAAKGKVTIGEAGLYNYATHVNGVSGIYWRAADSRYGRPLHPARLVVVRPATFDLSGVDAGTYPAWYDPSYWYAGLKARFDARQQLRRTKANLISMFYQFRNLYGALFSGLILLFWVSGRKERIIRDVARYGFLLIPAVAALLMYSLVWVEGRYIAPFFAIVCLTIVFSTQPPASTRWHAAVAAMVAAVFVVSLLWGPRDFIAPLDPLVRKQLSTGHRADGVFAVQPGSYQDAVLEMSRMGLRPGDHIASVDCSLLGVSMLARLARFRIVSEVLYLPGQPGEEVNDFWQAGWSDQHKVIDAFRNAGARAVLSEQQPGGDTAGWLQVGDTHYYLYWLDKPASPAPARDGPAGG